MVRNMSTGPGISRFSWGMKLSTFALPDPLEAIAVDAHGADAVIAPMPGLVKQLNAVKGAAVTKGDPLLVLEAMKMEHTLTAPRDGILAEVNTVQGDQVEDGAILIALEAEDEIKKGRLETC